MEAEDDLLGGPGSAYGDQGDIGEVDEDFLLGPEDELQYVELEPAEDEEQLLEVGVAEEGFQVEEEYPEEAFEEGNVMYHGDEEVAYTGVESTHGDSSYVASTAIMTSAVTVPDEVGESDMQRYSAAEVEDDEDSDSDSEERNKFHTERRDMELSLRPKTKEPIPETLEIKAGSTEAAASHVLRGMSYGSRRGRQFAMRPRGMQPRGGALIQPLMYHNQQPMQRFGGRPRAAHGIARRGPPRPLMMGQQPYGRGMMRVPMRQQMIPMHQMSQARMNIPTMQIQQQMFTANQGLPQNVYMPQQQPRFPSNRPPFQPMPLLSQNFRPTYPPPPQGNFNQNQEKSPVQSQTSIFDRDAQFYPPKQTGVRTSIYNDDPTPPQKTLPNLPKGKVLVNPKIFSNTSKSPSGRSSSSQSLEESFGFSMKPKQNKPPEQKDSQPRGNWPGGEVSLQAQNYQQIQRPVPGNQFQNEQPQPFVQEKFGYHVPPPSLHQSSADYQVQQLGMNFTDQTYLPAVSQPGGQVTNTIQSRIGSVYQGGTNTSVAFVVDSPQQQQRLQTMAFTQPEARGKDRPHMSPRGRNQNRPVRTPFGGSRIRNLATPFMEQEPYVDKTPVPVESVQAWTAKDDFDGSSMQSVHKLSYNMEGSAIPVKTSGSIGAQQQIRPALGQVRPMLGVRSGGARTRRPGGVSAVRVPAVGSPRGAIRPRFGAHAASFTMRPPIMQGGLSVPTDSAAKPMMLVPAELGNIEEMAGDAGISESEGDLRQKLEERKRRFAAGPSATSLKKKKATLNPNTTSQVESADEFETSPQYSAIKPSRVITTQSIVRGFDSVQDARQIVAKSPMPKFPVSGKMHLESGRTVIEKSPTPGSDFGDDYQEKLKQQELLRKQIMKNKEIKRKANAAARNVLQ